jgi:Fe-S-cluster containining protein
LVGNPTEQQVNDVNQKIATFVETNKQRIEVSKNLTDIKCPFLLQDNSCEIYPYRLRGCQLYPKTDCGMSTEEGLCESLDRFRNLRRALTKGYGDNYTADSFIISEDGIKPVKITKKQYDRCVAKLLRAGMTQNELLLFQHLNGR